MKYAIWLCIIKSLYFRWANRNKSLIIHDQHILLGFIVLKNLFVIILHYQYRYQYQHHYHYQILILIPHQYSS